MQRRSAFFGAFTGALLTSVAAISAPPPPAVVIDPLTAARSIDFGTRNGTAGTQRYIEFDPFDWHFGKTGLQFGMFAFWAQIDKAARYVSSPAAAPTGNDGTQYMPLLHSNSANATTGALTCGYHPNGAAIAATLRNRVYLRMNAASPSAATLLRVGPEWFDDRPRLVALRCDASGIYISMVEAGGTSVESGATTNPGGGSPATDSGTYNGNSNAAVATARPRLGAVTGALTPTLAQLASGMFAGLLVVGNNRQVTDAELIQLANGVDPATIFSGADLRRYHRLAGPTDLARTAGSDAGVNPAVATVVGDIPIRAGASLCPVTNGTLGGYMRPLSDGYIAGINPASPGPRPVPVEILNTGAASHWEARAVEAGDGQTVVTNWTQVTASPLATGASVVTELPGVAPNTGWNIIEARPVGTTLAVAGRRCGVGVKVIWDGQSQESIAARTVASDAGVLAATRPGPNSTVAFVCAIGFGNGSSGSLAEFRRPVMHRIVQVESDAGEAVKAFAKKWSASYPRALACIVSTAAPGTGRNTYYNDTASSVATPGRGARPDLYTGNETYRYFGDYVTEGSGAMTDLLLKAGKDISAIYGYYSVDDFPLGGNFTVHMTAYFNGGTRTGAGYSETGAPARNWLGMGFTHSPLRIRIAEHDRGIAAPGANQATIDTNTARIAGWRLASRTFVGSAPAYADVRVGSYHGDKVMESNIDNLHQAFNLVGGSARMGEQRVHMVAHDMGLTTFNPASRPVSATISGGTVTVAFNLANGGNLALVGGVGSTVKGFEVSTNGGTTWTSTNGTLTGNTVVLAGSWAAGNLVQYSRGGPINNAVPPFASSAAAYAQDNLDLDCLLIETRPDMSGPIAPGVPIMQAISPLVVA